VGGLPALSLMQARPNPLADVRSAPREVIWLDSFPQGHPRPVTGSVSWRDVPPSDVIRPLSIESHTGARAR
jgi:hypothetical protein